MEYKNKIIKNAKCDYLQMKKIMNEFKKSINLKVNEKLPLLKFKNWCLENNIITVNNQIKKYKMLESKKESKIISLVELMFYLKKNPIVAY